jgi:hypothetical protein
MFLQRLPVTLQTLLWEQEPGDIRSLAAGADRLLATHKPQSHGLVAHVNIAEEQPAQIAAVLKKEPVKKKKVCREEAWWVAVGCRWRPGDRGFWFWLLFWWTDSL